MDVSAGSSMGRCYNVLIYKRYRGDLRVEQPWRRYLAAWPRLLRRFCRSTSGSGLS